MKKPIVIYHPISNANRHTLSSKAAFLLKRYILENDITLPQKIALKIHSGEPGNVTFIHPQMYNDVISYLQSTGKKPFFIETNTASGPRSYSESHQEIAHSHGFTAIPFVIADGTRGFDHQLVSMPQNNHCKTCMIASGLAKEPVVLVMSHFKGHCMSGFGGAIKMLGIGFASGRGKVDVHSKVRIPDHETIEWDKVSRKDEYGTMIWNPELLYYGSEFNRRVAEYALAASYGKHHIYMNYAIDITENCDCDGHLMKPVYSDIGVFISGDPVAVDKACFDVLADKIGKLPFGGQDIFPYAESIGLGSASYELVADSSLSYTSVA